MNFSSTFKWRIMMPLKPADVVESTEKFRPALKSRMDFLLKDHLIN
jgi:hypothetical protein